MTEDIIEQSILTGYMNLRLIKSLVRKGGFLSGRGERREAEAESVAVEVPENGWEDFLFWLSCLNTLLV